MVKKVKKVAKKGRPQIEIDWKAVEKLAAIFCTTSEIAEFLGVSNDTLERRCKQKYKMVIADYLEKKRGIGRMRLRRKQYTVAESGNVTMLIWLGKQWLNQKDKIETDENKTISVSYLKDALDKVVDAE